MDTRTPGEPDPEGLSTHELDALTAASQEELAGVNRKRHFLHTPPAMTEHGSVSIAQVPDELTSTVAADLLGVSRPTLLRWARQGQIESCTVGSHARFRRADVLRLREERERERRAALQELREMDAENDFEFFEEVITDMRKECPTAPAASSSVFERGTHPPRSTEGCEE